MNCMNELSDDDVFKYTTTVEFKALLPSVTVTIKNYKQKFSFFWFVIV